MQSFSKVISTGKNFKKLTVILSFDLRSQFLHTTYLLDMFMPSLTGPLTGKLWTRRDFEENVARDLDL